MDSIHEIGSELSFIHRKNAKKKQKKKKSPKSFMPFCYALITIEIKLLL